MAEEQKKQNWFLRHKYLTAILVIIVIMMIGGSKVEGNSTSSNSTSGSKQEKAVTSFKMSKVGQNSILSSPAFKQKNLQIKEI